MQSTRGCYKIKFSGFNSIGSQASSEKILLTKEMAQTLPVKIALMKVSNVHDDLVNEVSQFIYILY